MMQGYLTPNRLDLTIRQNRHYFHSQCGLCQQLKQDYGPFARFLVNRDALILQLLTEAQLLQEPRDQKIRCGVQPFLHSAKANPKAAQFAAAVTLIMFWGKLTDTIQDAKGISGFFSRPIAKFMLWKNRHKIKKAENSLQKLGFDVQVIYDLFERQQQLEQSANLTNLEEAASPTAQGLAALFAHTAILAKRFDNIEALKSLGERVGTLLYILDAREDLAADLKKQRFNPLRFYPRLKDIVSMPSVDSRHSIDYSRTEDIKSTALPEIELKTTAFLQLKHHAINQAFSQFQTQHHQALLENIFSLGLDRQIKRTQKCSSEFRSKSAFALSGDCDFCCEGSDGHSSFSNCLCDCCDICWTKEKKEKSK